MANKTAKDELRALRRGEVELAALARQITRLRNQAALLQTAAPAPDSLSGRARTATVARLCSLQARYADQLAALVRQREDAARRILRLERSEWRALLVLYYLEGRAWDDVAAAMNYSQRQLQRLHHDALAALDAAG